MSKVCANLTFTFSSSPVEPRQIFVSENEIEAPTTLAHMLQKFFYFRNYINHRTGKIFIGGVRLMMTIWTPRVDQKKARGLRMGAVVLFRPCLRAESRPAAVSDSPESGSDFISPIRWLAAPERRQKSVIEFLSLVNIRFEKTRSFFGQTFSRLLF